MKRFLLILSVVLLVIVAGITLLLTTNAGLRLTLAAVNQWAPVEIHASRLKGHLFGTISAKHLNVQFPGGSIQTTKLELHYNPLALLWNTVEVDYLKIQRVAAKFDGKGKSSGGQPSLPKFSIKHTSIDSAVIQTNPSSQPITIQTIRWQALINPSDINIALTVGPVGRLFRHAQITAAGPLNNYKITASVVNNFTSLGANGSGNTQSMHLLFFSQSKDKRDISGTLNLAWQDEIKWNLTTELKNIDTSPFWQYGPKIYSLNASSSGQYENSLQKISWQLIAQTTAGSIQTQGHYKNKKLAFNWSTNIHANLPIQNISGKLRSKGSWDNGQTQGSLTLSNASWQDSSLANLTTSWNADVYHPAIHQLSTHFKKLDYAGLSAESGNITVSTTHNNQSPFSVDLRLGNDSTALKSLQIRGQLKQDKRSYSLSLSQFNLHALLLKWQLKAPSHLSFHLSPELNLTRWHQTPFCLTRAKTYFCLNSSLKNSNWALIASAKNIPLHNLINMGNTKLLTNLSANFERIGDQPWVGKAQVNIPQAQLMFTEFSVETPVKLTGTLFSLQLSPKKLNWLSTSNWGKRGYWNFKGSINRPTDANSSWQQSPINSQFRFSANDLGFINSLTNFFDIHSGSIQAAIRANGTVERPHLSGDIRLNKIQAEIIPVKNNLKINGHIKLNGKTALAKITIATKTAPLTLTANANIKRGFSNLESKFALTGKNVLFANSTNYTASGDLDLQGSLKHKHIAVSGTVLIPKATIRPTGISGSAQTLPSDIIVTGKDVSSHWSSTIDILFKLGKKVAITSKQLSARLVGQLRLIQKKDSELLGDGKIGVKDGEINDFDLNLQIDPDSSVSFNNTPLTSPFINIKLFRKIKQGGFGSSAVSGNTQLTVGLSAIGPYHNLVVTLYSSPVHLSQSDILSYLILGHPGSATSAFNLASLLATVGSMSSNNLSSGLDKLMSIKKTLGFSELGVQSNLTLDALGTPYGVDESGFVVGRYITPKMYVRYVSGISTALNLLQLQYFFSPRWSVQIQSGNVATTNVQGVDLMYHFTKFFGHSKKKKSK